MKRLLPLAIMLVFPAISSPGLADGHPLFEDHSVFRAVLTGPLRQVYGQKRQETRIYHPSQWSYVTGNGETQRLEVSIRTRGNFRREYCNLPPLQLNFKKKQVKGTLFAGQDKLKVVAPCNHGARYQQYVILEYLAYRTFQILTDYSYRARLIRLTYFDSDEQIEPWTDFVFVIEDDADMARRLDLEQLRVLDVDFDELDHPRAAVVQLFQLMMGNNDYSLIAPSEGGFCCHNVDVFASLEDPSGVIPIPFDFDFSGLVNAAYAAPPTQVPIRDVRQRYFYGLCQPDEVTRGAVAHVLSKREQIIELFSGFEELDAKNRAKSLEYIRDFYALIENPQRFKEEVLDRCRGSAHLERMLENS